MDLHSGLPYWILKNSMYNYFNPLKENIKTKVAVIGSGITAALVVHELCAAGIECVIIDKRTIATGSSAASTAQLQYEIDTPLHELIELVGEKHAVKAFNDCLQSITDLEKILKKAKVDADFIRRPTVLYTSNKKGLAFIEKEYEVRKKHNLPVRFLNAEELKKYQDITGLGALQNDTSAQMDAYKAAVSLIKHHLDKKEIEVYTHTEILKTEKHDKGYILHTAKNTINCEYVIVAAGFESGQFLPKKVMKLLSTYAIISEPVDEKELWPNKSLIWNTADPYLYMRTTTDNRMIVGGEDEDFYNPEKRDLLLRDKVKKLERAFKRLYPNIPFKTEMAWCGTFSATKDGLPYIGPYEENDQMLFALGYGGNGITFSVIAAQILSNIIQGKMDERLNIYKFHR